MISKKMAKALTKQINAEMYSAYLYMSMSSYAKHGNLDGATAWFAAQAKEEMGHAMKQYAYLQSQQEHVVLGAIEAPPATFKSLEDMFQQVLEHEKKVTALIHDLVNLAIEEKDHASQIFLQWFVSEQVEEEEVAAGILAKLKMIGSSVGSLFMLDKQLGKRGANS